MKFTFTAELPYENFKNEMVFEVETITDVIDYFQAFLLGTGFHPDCVDAIFEEDIDE